MHLCMYVCIYIMATSIICQQKIVKQYVTTIFHSPTNQNISNQTAAYTRSTSKI